MQDYRLLLNNSSDPNTAFPAFSRPLMLDFGFYTSVTATNIVVNV